MAAKALGIVPNDANTGLTTIFLILKSDLLRNNLQAEKLTLFRVLSSEFWQRHKLYKHHHNQVTQQSHHLGIPLSPLKSTLLSP